MFYLEFLGTLHNLTMWYPYLRTSTVGSWMEFTNFREHPQGTIVFSRNYRIFLDIWRIFQRKLQYDCRHFSLRSVSLFVQMRVEEIYGPCPC